MGGYDVLVVACTALFSALGTLSLRGEALALEVTGVAVTRGGETLELSREGSAWRAEDVAFALSAEGRLSLSAISRPVTGLTIAFRGGYPTDAGVRLYGIAGETSGWCPMTPWPRTFPQYLLVSHRGRTDGFGVSALQAGEALWQPSASNLVLRLERLGGRTGEIGRLVTRQGRANESPFAAARAFARALGRKGRFYHLGFEIADIAREREANAALAREREELVHRLAQNADDAEALDWMETSKPRVWRFGRHVRTFDWEARGGAVEPLSALTPRPVKVEPREGTFDALEREERTFVRRAAVPGAPADVADEAYVLEIAPTGVVITAASPRGEHWARVTLDQLERLAGGFLPCARIVDWPALKWRGYMNDCGRNYLDFEAVKTIVDVMSRAKMNLFHWHLTDYHGWRLESKRYPALNAPAAFSRQVGKFYTQAQFRELVAYAAERGITVMPELDVPGHTLALRRGLGVETMAEARAIRAVGELLEELCGLVTAETMPFVHLGTDEARAWPEYLDARHVSGWARILNRAGRRAVVWAPGIKLEKDIDAIEMAWFDNQITNSSRAYLDAARMYNGSWSPFDVSSKALFLKPCRWATDPARRLGAVTCTWHDDNVGENTQRLFNDAMVLPSIVAFGDNYWSGRAEDRSAEFTARGHARLPAAGSAALRTLAAFEHRLALQRDYVYRDVKYPFPFLEQTAERWRLTDEKGAPVAEDVPGAKIDLEAYCGPTVKSVTAELVLTSATCRVVGAWIDFTNYGTAYSRSAKLGTPKVGEWNLSGATASVNGVEILPPVWENPGAKPTFERYKDNPISWGDDLCEQPFRDEGPTRRALTPIRLKAGENRIRLVMPRPAEGFWGGTFAPLLGSSAHPREVL